jgi:hypothetical protein
LINERVFCETEARYKNSALMEHVAVTGREVPDVSKDRSAFNYKVKQSMKNNISVSIRPRKTIL